MENFDKGYKYFINNQNGLLGVELTIDYAESIGVEIDKLINHSKNLQNNKDIMYLKGDVAEYYASDTFNVNAAINKSTNRTYVPRSTDLGSPDVRTSWGDEYSLKYYKTPKDSALQQAKTVYERYNEYAKNSSNPISFDEYMQKGGYTDPNQSLYKNQYRLIPSDQFDGAKNYLNYKEQSESLKRPEQAKRYQITNKKIIDVIDDRKGTQSNKLTDDESIELAKKIKNGKPNIKDWKLLKNNKNNVKIINEAINAGLTAAAISVSLKVAPDIIKLINKLIENGEIEINELKNIGSKAIKASPESFIKGGISAGLTIYCNSGLFGEVLKNANPSIIGLMTVLTYDILKHSIDYSIGKISATELRDGILNETSVIICGFSLGIAIQSLLPVIPGFAFMIGNIVGTMVGSFVIKGMSEIVLSICIDTGFKMFGLVEQDYILPESVLKEIGINVFEYEKMNVETMDYEKVAYDTFAYNKFEYDKFDIKFIRRGVIGINKIGYTI